MQFELESYLKELNIGSENVIEFGLERIREINNLLNLKINCPLITVGGTNGKGSTCTFLSYIYKEAGFKVATFTSPHLLQYNERICINTEPVDNKKIIETLEEIKIIKGNIKLTFFEITLILAIKIFLKEKVDVIILEVGLGGRLDAVNIYDADVSIVTNVELDHQNYLGNTKEQIANEKSKIFRKEKFAIFGDENPPKSLIKYANDIESKLLLYKRDFYFNNNNLQWSFILSPKNKSLNHRKRFALPLPSLKGFYQFKNATCALVAIEALNEKLSVDIGSIKRGLINAVNIGRFQILPGRPITILDLAHNVHAACELNKNLIYLPFAKRKIAVFSILKDKNIDGILNCLINQFDEWLIAPLNTPRSYTIDDLIDIFKKNNIKNYKTFKSIKNAYTYAKKNTDVSDRIVVFGSFYTVKEVFSIIN